MLHPLYGLYSHGKEWLDSCETVIDSLQKETESHKKAQWQKLRALSKYISGKLSERKKCDQKVEKLWDYNSLVSMDCSGRHHTDAGHGLQLLHLSY